MITEIIINEKAKQRLAQHQPLQLRWTRIILLAVLAYEAAGCLLGGILLVAAPDGRLMEMPVDIMHGVFKDFLIPGIILFVLGILNTNAFVSVLRRMVNDWFAASLALGGLAIWFVVEIIILRELHWLHLMWGFPVFLGLVALIPLVVSRYPAMMRGLLICGILSSIWYAAINVFVPTMYEGYNMATLTVSELSAIAAPTRILWVLQAMLYSIMFAAFGWGIRQTAGKDRLLQLLGTVVIVYSLFNFYWPPMHQREVIAAGGGTLTDTLHIVWATTTLLLMMFMMGLGAAALGKPFRFFTIAIWVAFAIFGTLTWTESPGISNNSATPHIGVWERINIGAFMLWVIVLAIVLIRKNTARYLHLN